MKRKTLICYIALLLGGVLAALPLLSEEIGLFSFLLWIPFCYHIKKGIYRKAIKPRVAYLRALFFFQGYFAAAFSFFIAMYPLDFAGLNVPASVAVILAAVILLPLFQASVFAFSIYLLALAGKRKLFAFPTSFSLFFSSLCVLFFFLQNFTWMGVPWASPALALTSSPALIQSASLFGSFFLTFLILFVNALLAEAVDFFRECTDRYAILCLALAFLLFFSNLSIGAVLINRQHNAETEIKVALLQGNFPIKNEKNNRNLLDTYESLAYAAAEEGAQLMLWPESVIHHSIETDNSMQKYLCDIAKNTNAIQVVGASSLQEDNGELNYYNSLFIIYPDGNIGEEVYHKRRPVPFGEYLPWPNLFSALIPALAEINMLSRDIDAGEGTNLFHTPYGDIGALICFDSIYPALARESAKDGAQLLLLSTNDTWFDGSFGKKLHASHAVLRAVENGRSVARAGNTGYSIIINENGIIGATVEPDESGYTVLSVTLNSRQTLYTTVGDVFVYTIIGFLVLYPTLHIICHKRKEKLF